MKHQWLAYVIVALLAVGAGVAIAGLPDDVPVDATITAPTTAPTDTSGSTPPTTETAQTTAAPVATDVPETTAASAPDTTAPPATDPDVPETTEVEDVPDRADIVVAVANGAGIAGTAARNAERLAALGYEDITTHDGTEIVEFTVIYFADGFDAAAARMAEELELFPDFVAPLAEAPAVIDLPENTELLAYIGIDRAT